MKIEEEKGQLTPIRIQRKRVKGWRMPENTVSVCRPGKWGNPFHVADVLEHYDGDKSAAQADCVRSFRQWIDEGVTHFCDDGPPSVSEIQNELSGKNLACFCSLNEPCHADVLLELANPNTHQTATKRKDFSLSFILIVDGGNWGDTFGV